MAETKNKNYLSNKEIKAIAKANAKVIKELEAYKNRKCDESEFLSEMKDPNNILQSGQKDSLHDAFSLGLTWLDLKLKKSES